MIYKYKIETTPLFEHELESIYNYIAFRLNEPTTANHFFNKVIAKINSLQYLPERYKKISNFI